MIRPCKRRPIIFFKLPEKPLGASDMAYTALQLAALSSRLALEERTLVNHPNGRPENVAEHSHMLTIVAPGIAETYYPHLDANLVSRFAAIHDAVEAYVGDASTHYLGHKGLKRKAEREAQGLRQLKEDFAALQKFVGLVDQYEAQEVAEARFVRVVDKWTPILMHFADRGATLQSYTTPQKLQEEYEPRAQRLKAQFPDFKELAVVREELTALAAKHLF